MQNGPIVVGADGTEILFFDLAEIAETQNVVRAVCTAKKHSHNPVMVPGDKDKWDSGNASPWALRGVFYDEQDKLFKCWYNGGEMGQRMEGRSGYAISHDGVAWEKPELGVVEFAGSKRNNLVNAVPWACVIKDLAEPDPAKRYKMKGMRRIAYSPDGIHWSAFEPTPEELRETAADAVGFVRDEQDPDPARRFKYIYQYYAKANKPGPELVRFKGVAFSPDAVHWRGSADNPILCPNDSFEHENHFLMYIPYKGQYVVLYECAWYLPDGTGKHGRYVGDIRLAHSRDGEHFRRINPHEVVIPKGAWSEWDSQFLVVAGTPAIKDDTIYLYYAGMSSEWSSWPGQNGVPGDLSFDPRTGGGATGIFSIRRMGLATMRLDGFTCMRPSDGCSFGSFTTRPIQLPKDAPLGLTVNLADPQAGWSWLQAEVLDAANGEPLAGFARTDCPPVHEDGIRVPVRWKEHALTALAGRAIRLRFHLYGAVKLHSFALRPTA